jgi:ABC-type uncharacterized transport system substrate-binding protein
MDAEIRLCAGGTQPQSSWRRALPQLLGCAALLYLCGCVSLPAPVPDPAESLTAVTVPEFTRLVPIVEQPTPRARIPVVAPPVGIIVSSRLPAYVDVADRLIEMLATQDYVLRVLEEDDDAGAARLTEELNAAQPHVVVAIGLDAALLARGRIDAPLVFCQVFNYAEYPELAEATAGVSMLAAFDQQLAFWKAIDESLGAVGTIVGPGHESLISDSSAAAAAHGIALKARVSGSDRETVYQFRRLAAEIDGFWLIPDNRILSVNAIEELMSYAAARRLPVVVSSPELLRFCALMSLKPSPSHIADAVYSVLDSLQSYVSRGFEIVTPQAFDVDVNPGVAARLGIGVD